MKGSKGRCARRRTAQPSLCTVRRSKKLRLHQYEAVPGPNWHWKPELCSRLGAFIDAWVWACHAIFSTNTSAGAGVPKRLRPLQICSSFRDYILFCRLHSCWYSLGCICGSPNAMRRCQLLVFVGLSSYYWYYAATALYEGMADTFPCCSSLWLY